MTGTQIHPLAYVEAGARLGENVRIGPFCHVGSTVEIGDDCHLISHVVVANGVKIGRGAIIHPHAVLGGEPQNNKHQGGETALVVGKNCLIREGVTMNRGSDCSRGVTRIGENCQFLAYAHVAHDCVLGDHVTFANNVMIGGHVEIGDHVIIGGGGAVHQFVRVGHHAFVGGLAALVGDLIPYGIAIGVHAHLGGLNIIGMKRAGLSRHDIHAMRHAVALLFDKVKPFKQRAEDVRATYSDSKIVADMVNFIDTGGKRAFCTPKADSFVDKVQARRLSW